ncbi:tripartite tricarboxylate transporter TctB family protein [Pseudomonas sp. C2B4]|uniref:tripartite tricarboxylate transporter TctB family protein n=1 Tax=Pseudomonas sp. C2B4 TaxID=2735270 RepID=UPI0015862809|nr:tripartite tricarboxylate transporter TctB family protein [Pseudomonas sp. C2B4]NUU38024.1 tripartite tricarboxylate transporter TctB family protein [Pseudomonas sp. C2B4]
MDNNKDSGTNLAFWVPGSAVILSLVVSTFALTRDPFLEPRPIGAQFQAQMPIEARLWQDPFDALERYRKKLNAIGKAEAEKLCISTIAKLPGESTPPDIMVALVEGGPYADEVEQRRRIRYALLAGFKNSHRVPAQEQYIHCLKLNKNFSNDDPAQDSFLDIPYETFVSNPLDPAVPLDGTPQAATQTIVFWLKQDALASKPLQSLETLRKILACKTGTEQESTTATATATNDPCANPPESNAILKVIGPATSTVLRDMYQEQADNQASANVEIYSPLATADNEVLEKNLRPAQRDETKPSMKLLRTVSDDGTMTQLLLAELKLRRVDPVTGLRCSLREEYCPDIGWRPSNRIALISEWDSFYSRALIESFKDTVARDPTLREGDEKMVNQWILRFSYLRGLDGRLPEEAASSDKTASTDASKNNKDATKIDLSPLEKADGNAQLDYLRRLADHIAKVDATYRRNGEDGIGAIGILGVDPYDKLLALQALKAKMPYKLYFSTDLEARMLQRGQAETTRNMVLAAPYGLTLTRALQQDVPPFRDSLQSSVFISVLAALAPQPFKTKFEKFHYSRSTLLSPGIYEIGISGFIPLASPLTIDKRPTSCEAKTVRPSSDRDILSNDLMSLQCLQDPTQPPYPKPSWATREQFKRLQSRFFAGPLAITLIVLGGFMVWRGFGGERDIQNPTFNWVRGVSTMLYLLAVLCAFIAVRYWQVGFLWGTFALILLGISISDLAHRITKWQSARNESSDDASTEGDDASGWYIAVPLVAFILAIMWAFQMRSTLTEKGLGEPMFLFEGISAWPTVALRLAAVLISLSALVWGWRKLRVNRAQIEAGFHLRARMRNYPTSLWGQLRLFISRGKEGHWTLHRWCNELGRGLLLIFFPLMKASEEWSRSCPADRVAMDGRRKIYVVPFWREHCVCGSFGARMLRTLLTTWIFVVVTIGLMVVWPMERIPVRGTLDIWRWSWLVPNLTFQALVFWVVDANLLLTRFIRHLSDNYSIWPGTLQREHQKIFGMPLHTCIDEWVDLQLIAKRTSAVSRLIYAPTLVMLILLASRSSYFDNWPTPPSIAISFLLTALILLFSALSLRRAAEKARTMALQRIDTYLLEAPPNDEGYDKFRMIRERIKTLNTGSFSRYSEEPLIRALLLSLTGIGGSALVDALNYANF